MFHSSYRQSLPSSLWSTEALGSSPRQSCVASSRVSLASSSCVQSFGLHISHSSTPFTYSLSLLLLRRLWATIITEHHFGFAEQVIMPSFVKQHNVPLNVISGFSVNDLIPKSNFSAMHLILSFIQPGYQQEWGGRTSNQTIYVIRETIWRQFSFRHFVRCHSSGNPHSP